MASYKLSDISFIYPITPSSTMAEVCEEMSFKNEKNIFGNVVSVTEMQSEAGVIGSVHGASLSGSLATTFTSSQGLLLMIPNMYKIAGEMLPVTIHVASRSVASHALNIFCDHSDVMSTRQTGFAMLCSSNVQEAYDFALASHIASVKSSIPFLHFFDGFKTSHEISNISTFDDDELKLIYPFDELKKYKENAFSSNNPFQVGTNEGSDVFFQGREKSNKAYQNLPSVLQQTFDDINKISGRKYQPFEYFGSPKAKYVVVIMGSGYHTVKNYIKLSNNDDFGVLKVNLYRPFATSLFLQKLPATVQKIAVLDRTKEQGSIGEPLYQDVCTAVLESNFDAKVFGGRYGLGGKEFNLSMVKSVFENLQSANTKNHFTVGIDDDLTLTSLKCTNANMNESGFGSIFWGFGSDGTVSCAKNITKIVGENSNLFVQEYSLYDSKKSGGITRSFIRFDNEQINKPYLIDKADIVVCNNASFVNRYDITKNLKQNGILILNSKYTTQKDLQDNFCGNVLQDIKQKQISVYSIDANKIAQSCGIQNKISAIMQMAYFKISNIIDFKTAKSKTVEKIKISLAKKGEDIINQNLQAIDKVVDNIVKINIKFDELNLEVCKPEKDDYINSVLSLRGDELPVSNVNLFGRAQTGTSKQEKRNISEKIPCWKSENCLQCGKCSMVCPHSVIRSKILTDEQLKNAPQSLQHKKCNFDRTNNFVLEISPLDCTGCGLCEAVCPAREKAVVLQQKQGVLEGEIANYNFTKDLESKSINLPLSTTSAQFMSPYFEFSGACAGCGETPYIRLLTQLFGNRLLLANATGCSSIYGASSPTCPYTKDQNNQGPAWANSLFEDNAEFGFGIYQSEKLKRQSLKNYVEQNINIFNDNLKTILNDWLQNFDDEKICNQIYLELKNNSTKYFDTQSQFVLDDLDAINKKTTWIIGGDGWAYDIGFGGLDHVLSSNENLNILVLDTELYSNTGGQTSKSSRQGSVQKFASGGKKTSKKQLALMAMTYKNVYVAQVCIGADPNQTIKAFAEAENHKGVSLIIAYCPCINHGITKNNVISSQIDAVKSGYWHLFRYNPSLSQTGKNPLVIDSGKPQANLTEYMMSERRYASHFESSDSKVELQQIEKEQNDFYDLLIRLSK